MKMDVLRPKIPGNCIQIWKKEENSGKFETKKRPNLEKKSVKLIKTRLKISGKFKSEKRKKKSRNWKQVKNTGNSKLKKNQANFCNIGKS